MNAKIIIQLPQKLKDFLDDTANDLYDDFKGKYFTKDEFWITIRSFEAVDSYSLKQIKSALKSITSKSDPFILYCDQISLLNPRKKSSLVYSLRGLTNKLYNLHQNIENALFTRQIGRDKSMPFPHIEIAQKVPYRQLPYIKTPEIPIDVGSIVLIEQKQVFTKRKYEVIEEFPLFGGQLFVAKIEGDNVTCTNSFGKDVILDISEMPKDLKEKDVIIKAGIQYAVDVNETRVRAIQEQIEREKQKNIQTT